MLAGQRRPKGRNHHTMNYRPALTLCAIEFPNHTNLRRTWRLSRLVFCSAATLLVAAFFAAPNLARAGPKAAQAKCPPAARQDDTVDMLHGVSVPDPYRWLEDQNSAENTCVDRRGR